MLIYILSALAGIIAGVFTGLIPGIHPNTVIFTSLPVYIDSRIALPLYLSFITGLSISHTFHDFLPAIFLSAPEAEAALSAVAAPEMVERGKGLTAFKYTVYGGITALLFVGIITIPLFIFLEQTYTFLVGFMEYILLFFLLFIIFESENYISAAVISLFCGLIGVVSFQAPVNQQFVLVPIFAGLFAAPGVLEVLGEEFTIPDQTQTGKILEGSPKGGLTGSLAGLMAGIFPGIGSAASTSFLTPIMGRSRKAFLTAMGAVNTSDIIFSLLTLQILGKARSGVSVAFKALSAPQRPIMILLSILTVFSVIVSVYLASSISKLYISILRSVDLRLVLYLVLAVIFLASLYLTGFIGLLVFFTSFFTGKAAVETGNRRVCMAVLIVPSILFFDELGLFM